MAWSSSSRFRKVYPNFSSSFFMIPSKEKTPLERGFLSFRLVSDIQMVLLVLIAVSYTHLLCQRWQRGKVRAVDESESQGAWDVQLSLYQCQRP